MMRKKQSIVLSQAERKKLFYEIKAFLDWLHDIKVQTTGAEKYKTVLLREAKREDWVMWVRNPDAHEVQFNTYLIGECSFEYFLAVILHECVHLFVHDLPNKSDAKRLRDDFGDELMRLLDIEADYFVAEYFRHTKQYSLVKIFQYFHEGSSVFGDPKTRIGKLERFVGTILSISNAHFNNTTRGYRKIFLPTVQNILTDGSLHVLTLDSRCFSINEINASFEDFVELNRCYTKAKHQTPHSYASYLIQFSAKALRIDIPQKIRKELALLERAARKNK